MDCCSVESKQSSNFKDWWSVEIAHYNIGNVESNRQKDHSKIKHILSMDKAWLKHRKWDHMVKNDENNENELHYVKRAKLPSVWSFMDWLPDDNDQGVQNNYENWENLECPVTAYSLC